MVNLNENPLEHILKIVDHMQLKMHQVEATALLLAQGATVPFIARYRKEATGGLDEVAITQIRDTLERLKDLDARRTAIIQSLNERNLLTPTLETSIKEAQTMTALEDIYLPFKPKRRTKATIAREKGLEPLAEFIFENQEKDYAQELLIYVDPQKEVHTPEEALSGAKDIIAERISDHPEARSKVRHIFENAATIESEIIPGKEEEGAKFRDYFKWSEPLPKCPSHRLLAIRRGEKEGFLQMRIHIPLHEAITQLEKIFIKGMGSCGQAIQDTIKDAYKRLLCPSLETEARVISKEKADLEAVKVFAENLRELLLASPLGQKKTLAIDPGFRTGCKVVCLDAQGKLLHHDVIYISQSEREGKEAKEKILGFCKHFQIEAIAIGNGTASRETETFIKQLGLPSSITVVMVNESGASIYSASEVARQEFPDHDITVRGSVSIGRRLMDPLAELVKLDPKSIGVGQYQHDVDQNLLKTKLDDIVISCVNQVGVELNTASKELLSYVSGLNNTIATNIIHYRDQNGPFASREALKKVPRLGPKAFEQAAGFLRIRDGLNRLDSSAVHPESYHIVESMAKDQSCTVEELLLNSEKRAKIKLESYITDSVGLPTLRDIFSELAKPGRDPRKQFECFSFMEGIHSINDLKPGMKIPGIVTNVTAFGAFVDIGVHQDGLVHVSQLSDNFIKEPAECVKVHQKVQVTVLEVDAPRKRISLSMKTTPDKTAKSASTLHKEHNTDRKNNRFANDHVSKNNFNNSWVNKAFDKNFNF